MSTKVGDASDKKGALAPYNEWQSLPAMFFDCMDRMGSRPFLWAKQDHAYRSQSFEDAARTVSELAHGLIALGMQRGDRVVLVSENRPEWLIADVAIMAAGGVAVPAYITNTDRDHQHILDDSGARFAIVSSPALAAQLLPAAEKATDIVAVIAMDPPDDYAGTVKIKSWEETLASGRDEAAHGVPAVSEELGRDDLSCIIYTSGTGGAPKGVMLSHGAILTNCMSACDLLYDIDNSAPKDEVFLSFLPLSHSYEHSAGQFFPISIGAEIYYAEGIETLARNMGEARPTIMTAVPRLYETMHGRIISGLRSAPAMRRKLFFKAVELGRKRYEDPSSLSLGDKLVNAVLDKLVRAKVRERFGGRIKALVSGGAPLNYEIGVFFTALGLRLLQGYGQTESAPVISCNRPWNIKIDSVGPALEGVEVKIAEDGEILARGENIMQGYWNNPEATAEVLKDGWLHTGDVGEIDADGYIRITDRKKDIIVVSGGDTLSPQRVEGFLTIREEIGQAMVYGDKRSYLVALIVPDPAFAKDWAKSLGKSGDLAELCEDAEFKAAISEAIDQVNKDLSVIERIRRFALIPEEFTTDNEMLTPSMKIRRHVINRAYAETIEDLY